MIADRPGTTTGYALDNLQQRGEMLLGPGVEVYEGMVVGENARPGDMVVNVVRDKQKTNIRTHSHDDAIKAVVTGLDVTRRTASLTAQPATTTATTASGEVKSIQHNPGTAAQRDQIGHIVRRFQCHHRPPATTPNRTNARIAWPHAPVPVSGAP